MCRLGKAKVLSIFLCPALPTRPHQTVVVVKSGQDDLSQTLYSQKWPKSVFEIVVRIERKKISAVNVPNGVSDVPIGTSQFCRCCATIKSEKVSATNDRLLSLVHRMFTNTYPAFCRGNVRCKVKGGLEQQRARFYRGARFRIFQLLLFFFVFLNINSLNLEDNGACTVIVAGKAAKKHSGNLTHPIQKDVL